MLNESATEWLMGQLAATSELLDRPISPVAVEMMAADLSNYPREVLAAALQRVRTEHTGKLTPKAVIERIDEVMGRPGSNEAWATALLALDERNTVVWTEEMEQAWVLAQPLAAGGDLIGARMAFKDAYDRLVRTAREERRLPVTRVSVGWDAAGRAAPVNQAVKLGYMAPGDASGYLPAPNSGGGVVALLMHNGQIAGDVPPEVRARLLALRDEIAADGLRRDKERADLAAAVAADLATRKATAQNLADTYDEAAKLRADEWLAAGGDEPATLARLDRMLAPKQGVPA